VALYTAYDRSGGVDDVLATVRAAERLEGASGKVGVMFGSSVPCTASQALAISASAFSRRACSSRSRLLRSRMSRRPWASNNLGELPKR
jgi:hypothetical protein